jgi:hypothetical protein
MKIYVIDTAREAFWNQLNRTDLFFVCDEGEDHQYSFEPADLIFAHSHKTYVADNPDLVLDKRVNNWPIVQDFCRALEACQAEYRPRAVVLYSGGDCRDEWRMLVTANDAPLNGFPQERIHCYPTTIPRQQCADALRNMIDAVLTQLQAAGQGEPVSLDTSWLEEAKLAARLLVEASELPKEECNGIKIVKPSAELVQLANQVIDPSGNGRDLTTAAEALCQKLASLIE